MHSCSEVKHTNTTMLMLLALVAIMANIPLLVSPCCSNTDCRFAYTGIDACFMKATFPGESTEGFCYGGDCRPLIGRGRGKCQKKKSLGESCRNKGGNADNNFCVTRLCSSSTSKCEVRKSGCASFSDCIGAGVDLVTNSKALQAFTSVLPASSTVRSSDCNDPNKKCNGKVGLHLTDNGFLVKFSSGDKFGVLSLDASVSTTLHPKFDVDLDLLGFNFDFKFGSVSFAVDGDLTLEFPGVEKSFSQSYFLSDGLKICKDSSGKTCRPHFLVQKMIQIGKASVELLIGFQVVAEVSGAVSVSGYKHVISIKNQKITVPMEVKINKNGVSFSPPTASPWQVNTRLENVKGSVEANLKVRLAAQMFILVNGVEAVGGLEAQLNILGKADVQGTKCASGSFAVNAMVFLGFYLPPLKIHDGVKATCKMLLGKASKNPEAAKKIQPDRFGSQCVILDSCKKGQDMCTQMGNLVGNLIEDVAGTELKTKGVSKCLPIVKKTFQVYFSTGSCSSKMTVPTACKSDSKSYKPISSEYCSSHGEALVPRTTVVFYMAISSIMLIAASLY